MSTLFEVNLDISNPLNNDTSFIDNEPITNWDVSVGPYCMTFGQSLPKDEGSSDAIEITMVTGTDSWSNTNFLAVNANNEESADAAHTIWLDGDLANRSADNNALVPRFGTIHKERIHHALRHVSICAACCRNIHFSMTTTTGLLRAQL